MKCDELQYERLGDANKTYPSSTLVIRKQFVDAAIAELKDELENACLERDDNQTVIDEFDDENRRLKRALWLARADRAVAEQTVDEWSRYKEKHPFGSWRDEPFEHWVHVWIYIEKLCRKIAKEYK